MNKKYRLAVLNSHPVQYFAPLYRKITEKAVIDIHVFYCSRQGVSAGFVDQDFGKEVVWDTDLLSGYRYFFLRNLFQDRGIKGFFNPINFGIVQEIAKGKYDAILIHGHNSLTNLLAIIAAKIYGTAVFMRSETHLLLKCNRIKKALRKLLLTWLYRLCDACLYIGTKNREFYEYHGVSAEKLFFTPYVVDNDFFMEKSKQFRVNKELIKKELSIPAGVFTILFASKFIPRKRAADLLQAYSIVQKTHDNIALLMIGDGPDCENLKNYATAHDLKNVLFLGFKNQSELPQYYAIADVFVLPSVNEPWGLVVNEAMCAGVPVITTTEVGAARDLVQEGETGSIFSAGDIKELALKIENIFLDPRFKEKAERAGRGKMMGWNYEECIAGIECALRNAQTG